jgi:hypothetical protein
VLGGGLELIAAKEQNVRKYYYKRGSKKGKLQKIAHRELYTRNLFSPPCKLGAGTAQLV